MISEELDQREFIHSWYLLIMSFLSLLFLAVSSHFVLSACLYVLVLFLLFKNGLGIRSYLKILFWSFFFGLSLIFLTLLIPADSLRDEVIVKLGPLSVYRAALLKGIYICLRLVLVASLSMATMKVLKMSKVILYLMIHKVLKVIVGYPLLIALNSISLFKAELDRISIIAKQRELPWQDRLVAFFPLLVFAIRHSQRGALSLVTRGLSEDKGFFFRYNTSVRDRFFLLLFFFIYFILIVLFIFL